MNKKFLNYKQISLLKPGDLIGICLDRHTKSEYRTCMVTGHSITENYKTKRQNKSLDFVSMTTHMKLRLPYVLLDDKDFAVFLISKLK